MAKTIAGFVQWEDLINNSTRTAVNLIGELSPTSRTFTRNLREYPNLETSAPDFTIFVHNYLDENNHIINTSVEKDVLSVVFDVVKWMTPKSRNGEITANKTNLLRDITLVFGKRGFEFECGDIIQETFGDITVYCPTWIRFKKGKELDYRFWFSDEFFQRRVGGYPYFEYVHIPPTTPIDNLTGTVETVKPIIESLTNKVYQDKVNEAIDENGRQTKIHVHSLTWYQLSNNTRRIEDVSWTTIIYGIAGDNIESINASLSKFILDNSTHDEGDWTIIHPDLFIKDEYIIVPFWDRVAIDKSLQGNAIYSSALKAGDLVSKNQYFTNMSSNWIKDHVSAHPSLWQSISFLACGGLRNKIFSPDFDKQYQDYILAKTGTSDFDRMSERTREMKIALETVLPHANKWEEGYSLPSGVNVMTRGGNTYLSTTVNKITFNVLTRNTMVS